ncbi:MAG: hypothetical protein PHS49_01235 [Candidatus Gracilibacteria bacterium]|nr:hypothetical protein [Candidatus Gracilibacteria bacterium]
MKTNTYTKPENFIDFDAPDAEEIIDKLLAEAEKSPTISFEEFFEETNKFRINLGKNV